MNCVHGIDARFCAACNRPTAPKSGSAVGRVRFEEILTFLNDERLRATYGAVAEALGVNPSSIRAVLGPHRPEALWIVSPENGLPTDYEQSEWHPALLSSGEIITSGRALMLRMMIRRGKAPAKIPAGLCATCRHSEQVTSARGSTFVLCRLSASDPQFPKYPRLPVTACVGYVQTTTAPST